MASHVKVLIGPIGQDSVFAEGDTVAEIIRYVLSIYPQVAGEINDNKPELLVSRLRCVTLNDEYVLQGCGAWAKDGTPVSPVPDWYFEVNLGLNAQVSTGDTIRVFRMLCC